MYIHTRVQKLSSIVTMYAINTHIQWGQQWDHHKLNLCAYGHVQSNKYTEYFKKYMYIIGDALILCNCLVILL